MSKTISKGARRLSSYPYRKILVTCARCNLRVQYDRDALAHGWWRPRATGPPDSGG